MEIKMRTPEGKPSLVGVERVDKGIVLQLSRGNMLVKAQLPPFVARSIAEAILKLLQEAKP